MKISQKLKELREEQNKSQYKVSQELGIERYNYANWEQDRSEPNLEMLSKLADIFNCSIDYLLGKEDNSSNKKITSSLTSKEERLLKAFQFLDNDEQNKIIEDCEYFANKHNNKNKIAK